MWYGSNAYMSHAREKNSKIDLRPAKTKISLVIRPVWSMHSLSAERVAKDASFPNADSEYSD